MLVLFLATHNSEQLISFPAFCRLTNQSEFSLPVLQSWLLAESLRGGVCVLVCVCA